MKQALQDTLPEGCTYVDSRTVVDERGALTFVEKGVLPFKIERIFWITSVPEGKTRGGHAHKTCIEAVFAANGSFDITIDDGSCRFTAHIEDGVKGIIVPAGAWCELFNFTPGSVCIVAASERYDPQGYVTNYGDYLRLRTEGRL